MTAAATGPVMFAYDGSELAKTAIAEAAGQLNHRRKGTRRHRVAAVQRRVPATP